MTEDNKMKLAKGLAALGRPPLLLRWVEERRRSSRHRGRRSSSLRVRPLASSLSFGVCVCVCEQAKLAHINWHQVSNRCIHLILMRAGYCAQCTSISSLRSRPRGIPGQVAPTGVHDSERHQELSSREHCRSLAGEGAFHLAPSCAS